MRILLGHNYYRTRGGECQVFDRTVTLLRQAGHEVLPFTRDSAAPEARGRFALMLASLRVTEAVTDLNAVLDRYRPDVAHFHNLYPWITSKALRACAKRAVPVVLTCHNYRLFCPIGTFYTHSGDCFRCAPGRNRWCLLRNCRHDVIESAAYALRSSLARLSGDWGAVTLFTAISGPLAEILVDLGLPEDRLRIVRNPVAIPEQAADPATGSYVAFAGRPTPEKGFAFLLEAARRLPHIPFRVAGTESGPGLPANVRCLGQLPPENMDDFWAGARLAVVPSLWLEPFGLTAAEPQAAGVPVVAFRSGGLAEIVDHGRSGFLCARGDTDDLAARIDQSWSDPEGSAAMGRAGRERMTTLFGEDRYVRDLLTVYEEARGLTRKGGRR